MTFITEGDLYRLVANSKLPGAVRFQSWVFDEVLPTIRKTGSYSVKDAAEREDLTEKTRLKVAEIIGTSPQYNLYAVLSVLKPYLSQDVFDHYENTPKPKAHVSNEFADMLKTVLEEKQMTQKDLAANVGFTKSTISHYCNGKSKPDHGRLQRVADALNVPVDIFYQ